MVSDPDLIWLIREVLAKRATSAAIIALHRAGYSWRQVRAGYDVRAIT